MKLNVDAIFDGGVFRPVQPVPLRDQERVRLEVESMSAPSTTNGAANGAAKGESAEAVVLSIEPTVEGRQRLAERLRSGGRYHFDGGLPSRDELHER